VTNPPFDGDPLPAIDLERLRDLFGNDKESMTNTLKLAIVAFSALCDELGMSVSEKSALAAAHSLKGSAINVGAVQIYDAALAIEASLEAGESLDSVRGLIGRVNATLDRFKHEAQLLDSLRSQP
jgi:HPt (histidine-containing phosphotransfer) domain-containing protein